MADELERGIVRVRGFQDPEMDFQLMRQLGSVRYGGAAVGECLSLAAQIGDADPARWVQAFAASGQRWAQEAAQRAARGHAISARDLYLLACNSYRAAEYYCSVDDPAHRQNGLDSRQAFLSAMQCERLTCTELWFTQHGLRLPAYHLHDPQTAGDRLLMIISGFDGTLEETYLSYGLPAIARGYDLLLFTGPGQMDTWRFNAHSHFVPDFEGIGRVVVDHALSLSGMDARHVALMGISFGGYFAARIAAHEPRVRALILNSPVTDLHAYMTSFVGFDPATLSPADDFGVADLDQIPDADMSPQAREMSRNLMLRFGQASFRETYRYLRAFRLDEQALRRIGCPALALVGEGEGPEPLRQWQAFQDAVSGPVSKHLFTTGQGADGHGQVGNLAWSAAVSMDWLNETFGVA